MNNDKILLPPHYSDKRRFAISLDASNSEADLDLCTVVCKPLVSKSTVVFQH